ncbi:MAG: MG2 domain-containing protein [bacterium]
MSARRTLLALVFVALLSVPATPVAAKEVAFGLNVNLDQQVVRPGGDLGVTVYAYTNGRTSSTTAALAVNLESIGPGSDWMASPSLGRARSDISVMDPGTDYGWSHHVVWAGIPAGVYRLEALEDGDVQQRLLVQVTDLGLVVQTAGPERLVWAVSLASGEPVAGAQIRGASTWTTGADGVAVTTGTGDLYASSSIGPAYYTSSGQWFAEPAGAFDNRIHVYTDRPLYRPGQTVHTKVVAWHVGPDGLVPLPGDAVSLSASVYRNGRMERVASLDVPLDAYGAGEADIILDATAGLGTYDLGARWKGSEAHGGFEVQEYRLPGFKVTLSPTAQAVAAGDPLEVLIAAARFSGAPLDQGKAHYVVSGQPNFYSTCRWCRQPDQPAWQGSQESGDLDLRSDGTAILRLKSGDPGAYTLTVQVTAPNGERIEATQMLEVAAAGARLDIDLPRQGLAAGQATVATVHFTDLAGRPLSGRVDVDLVNTDATGTIGSFVVDVAQGVGTMAFTPRSAGSYRLEARARDAAGRAVTGMAWFWVASDTDSFGGGELQVRAESETVRPGEAIRLHVSSAMPQPILVTTAAGRFLDHRVLRGVGTALVPTTGASDADAHATVVQVIPADAATHSAMAELRQAQATITLAPHPQGLQVTVTPDKPTYHNGDTARVLIEVHDADGRPVQAQVSVAMVDEALLALRSASGATALSDFYPATYGASPETSWGGFNHYVMFEDGCGFCEQALPAMAPRMGAAGDALLDSTKITTAGIQVRSYFPETALWMPRLETDAKGVLRLAVALPDTLTTWAVDVEAITQHGQAGAGTTHISTLRDIEADLYAPRSLVAGDDSTVQATVYNHMAEQRDVQVLLVATGVDASGHLTRTLSLAPGASGLVSFPLHATASGTADLIFYAWSDGDVPAGDAIERTFPVKPHGTPSLETRSGRGDADLHLTVPAAAAEGKATIDITVTPTIGNAMVDALPYLTGYPYGCVEQTLSRFLPDVAVARAANTLGIRGRIDADLDDQVKAGLERLYGYQHSSGAWGWWTTDDDNPYTTAYTVYGLAVARQAGYTVDADVLSRGVAALSDMAKSSTGALHAYQVYALSLAAPSAAPAVSDATEPAELAMAILAAHAKGDDAWGRARLSRLEASAVRSGDLAHWPDPAEGWTVHGMSSDTMVTALALRAIVAVSPNDPDAGAAVRWLLANRAGGNWESTKDTAEAIFALVDYLTAAGDLHGASGATITVDGVARHVAFDAASGWAARPAVHVDVGTGDHEVRIVAEGDGPLYWSTAMRHFDGGEPIRSDAGAFHFERRITDGSGNEVTRLKVGEEATVEVRVTAVADARYVQVEDPFAAGLEASAVDQVAPFARGGIAIDCFGPCRPYQWANAEVHDDRVAFFADNLAAGQAASYTYAVRAVFPGCYHVMPPAAVGMYDPGLAGHGDETRFCVDGPAELQAGRVGVTDEGGERKASVNLYPVQQAPTEVEVQVVGPAGEPVGEATTVPARVDDAGTVHIDVGVPEGAFTLLVSAGDATVVIRHDDAPQAAVAAPGFNATLETRWTSGTVQFAASPLRPGAEPDYRAVFQGVGKDALVPAPPEATHVPWPAGLVWLALAFGLMVVRRRRSDE